MLSSRLQAIANLVPKNSNIIDVGCEHALLDIYLTFKKNVKCIATDINDNSIKVAKQNIEDYKLTKHIILKHTNGLLGIDSSGVDTVIIAGMGTRTILKILDGYYFDNLIIQSNNDLELLRKKIIKRGYYIQNEEIVYEHKKYYVVIKFKKGRRKYHYLDYLLGSVIKLNKRLIDQQYINYLIGKYDDLLIKVPKKNIVTRLYFRYKRYLLINIKGRKLDH